MIIHMIKQELKNGSKLIPYSENDVFEYCKLKYNVVYRVNIKQPRNYKHHSKYFALCRMVCDNTEYFTNEEQVSYYLKLKTGHIDEIVVGEETIVRAKSINFDTMDQTAFEVYYNSCLPVICELLGCTEYEVKENEIFYM